MSFSGGNPISRRRFLLGAGTGILALSLSGLEACGKRRGTAGGRYPSSAPAEKIEPLLYGDWRDVYREKWSWDRIAKVTHTRANCISACSWNVYIKDGLAWREEQNTIYESSREGLPDFNPRGCQKGACYSDLQAAESRIRYPLKRLGERGEGRWKRVRWDEALAAIADGIIDAAVAGGTDTILHDHGTTNAAFGPDTACEIRYVNAIGATIIDSWAGVGDMPMGAVQTWGMYNCEGTSDDWFRSDYIVVWVGNPSYTRIPEMHFLHEARYRGARLLVIAPDYNATAIHADLWMNPKPETDAALGLAAAEVIVREGLYDAGYVREQTDLPLLVRDDTKRFLRQADLEQGGREDLFYFWDERKATLAEAPGCEGEGGRTIELGGRQPALQGRFRVRLGSGQEITVRPVFERLRERLRDYEPERAARVTGLPAALIRRFARDLASARRAMILASWGACKHYHSDLFQRAMILLMALTGNQGRSGGGLRIAAWWQLKGCDRIGQGEMKLSLWQKLRLIPGAIRGFTPREYERLFTMYSEQNAVTPLMPFLYVHAGYRELWTDPELADPALTWSLDSAMKEAIARGWIPIYPSPERRPRVFLFTGCNPLRRWPAGQIARKHLWPKLDLIVAVNFRMSTSAMHADYVLPVAAYYEKYGIKYGQSYLPYIVVNDKATEPLSQAKCDWEVFGRLTRHIQERAIARGVSEVRGPQGRTINLAKAYHWWTAGGRYDPMDPRGALDEILRRSPSIGGIGADEALAKGAVRIQSKMEYTPIHQISSDYDPHDSTWPHRWFVEQKRAWPTITGRQQFFLDHPWYLDAGEELPLHKDPPGARSQLPLRISGGHTRWSIHAIWRDHALMLRLQRGEPVCFMSPVDARPRGIHDGERIRVRNKTGAFESLVKLASRVRPGDVIIYHAWEPYQFPGWKGQQEPVAAPWKAIHLAGGYGQLHYRMFYAAPGHAPRGAPVEVERVAPASPLTPSPAA